MKKGFYFSGLVAACLMLLSISARATVPVITTDPSSVALCSGATAKLAVAANDTPGALTIHYAWQVSTDGGTTWSDVTDVSPYAFSTTDTLYILTSTPLNGYKYRSIVSDSDGADTSLVATLTVDTLNAGTITGAATVCIGLADTLSNTVTGGVWSHVNLAADTLTPTGIVTGLAAGFDTVTYTVTNTCGAANAQMDIRIDATATAMPITGPYTTCVGHTIDLANANVLGTWVWNASNASASITHAGLLTGLAQGADTITYVFTNACNTVSSSAVVVIDTVLGHGTISGPTSVCAGSWIHLTETVGGGVWLSSSSSVAIVDGSGNVTGVAVGAVTISYLVTNGCGASIATYTVEVQATADAITGGDSVGVHGTLPLFDVTPNGTWSIADTIATINDTTGVVTGVSAGTTTVTYTVTNGCGTSSATMTLYVGVPPSGPIHGPDSVCIGSTITLSDTTVPGGIWISRTGSIATIDSNTGVLTGVSSGDVVILYVMENAFGRDTVNYSVFVNAPPVVVVGGPASVALGQEIYLLGAPCCGTWSPAGDSVGSFVNYGVLADTVVDSVRYASVGYGAFVIVHDGTATLTYTVTNSCGTRSSNFVIHLAAPSLVPASAAANELLNVYPNPNQGDFTLNLVSGINKEATIVITNIVGEKVKELTISANTATNIKLDQPAGVYFISANTASGKYSAKINITN